MLAVPSTSAGVKPAILPGSPNKPVVVPLTSPRLLSPKTLWNSRTTLMTPDPVVITAPSATWAFVTFVMSTTEPEPLKPNPSPLPDDPA